MMQARLTQRHEAWRYLNRRSRIAIRLYPWLPERGKRFAREATFAATGHWWLVTERLNHL